MDSLKSREEAPARVAYFRRLALAAVGRTAVGGSQQEMRRGPVEPPGPITVGRAVSLAARHARRGIDSRLAGVSLIFLLIIWEIGSDTGLLDKQFFASPSAVIAAGWHAIFTALFWSDTWTSGSEFLAGYALSVAAGLIFGFAMGWSRRFGYFFRPWIDALNAVPSIALMPVVLIWFGLAFSSKVALVFATTFVPVVVNVYTGIDNQDVRILRVARSFGASPWFLLRTVAVPSAAPFAFAAARIGVGRAVSGVVVGEFFAAQAGLAFWIFQQAQVLDTANVLFGALAITFLALGAFRLVRSAERRALRWRSAASRGAAWLEDA